MAKRVLLWVYLDSHFREMIRVARLLKAHTDFEPFFLFEYHYPRFAEDVAVCVAESFDFVDAPSPLPEALADGPPAWRYWRQIKGFARKVYRGLRRINYYRGLLKWARNILDEERPALLIVPEDNVEYNIPMFVKAARERHIPSMVIPYTIANAREPAEAYWQNPRHLVRGLFRRIVARLFPNWVYTHRGRRLLRLPADHIVAQEWLGLAAPLPWVLNSGFADVIAVESEAIRQYYRRAGLPAEQLRTLGSLRQDEMFRYQKQARINRERLLSRLGWNDGRPVILCALPPNQHPEDRPDCEFSKYQDLLEFWAETLGSIKDCHVIVNPHPRTPLQEIEHLERYGIRIVRDDIAQLMPLCDVFVASVSATISMALACGKPVVNYDVYRYRYDDFEGVPEVNTFELGTEFPQALRAALGRAEEIRSSSDGGWGVLDGKAGDRLIGLIRELTSANEVRAAA